MVFSLTQKVKRYQLPFLGIILISLQLFLVACQSDEPTITRVPTLDPDPVEPASGPGIGEARDISSFDLVAEMGVGWNLGNSFDVTSRDKTAWGNPLPSKDMIDAVAAMGFKTLRIPITWGYNQMETAPFTVEADYLDRVKSVVDYGFQNKMHVIINVHHDNDWVRPIASEAAATNARLSSLWTQVALLFQDYNDSLIFEALNEPRLEGIPEEWTGGTPAGRRFVNEFNKTAVDAIRATGGNNELRHIMIPTWAASTIPFAMDDLTIPNNDDKIIISLHTYFPWPFAGEARVPWGSDQDRAALRAELNRVRQKWIVEEGRPVILGEWGSIDRNPIDMRVEYAEFYAREAAERELLTVVWDDGGMFRLFNRRNLTFDFDNIATTIVNASER